MCSSFHPSIYLSFLPFIYLSFLPFIHPAIRLFLWLSVLQSSSYPLSVCLSLYNFIMYSSNCFINPSFISPSIHPSIIYWPICPSLIPCFNYFYSFYLSIYSSVNLFILLQTIHLFTHPSVFLSFYLLDYLLIFSVIHSSVHLTIFHPSISTSVLFLN